MFSESPCLGVTFNDHIQGSTAADTLHNMHRLFCGCKFIIRGVMNGSRIIFPNLRIIRGNAVFVRNNGYSFAMKIINVNASAFILPSLTKISKGGVYRHIWQHSAVEGNSME